ncbi:MAG: phosphoribosylamine--glycine ligase [Candidatus Caenarcaniphilales bacterium]|nr:phosphoribosylamine--glycine ligase [Candidatus Caenarcaniphilales bacterium]
MRILVIGSGGREHALVLSLSLSQHVEEVFCCPGNPGISQLAQCSPIKVDDFAKLAEFAASQKIDLTIVGPDDPLADGIVDFFEERNLKIFGPRKDAAKLEWSKYFAKEFMLRRGIPSAKYAAFDRREHAIAYAYSRQLPVVIKADGLARGKGVAVVNSYDGAIGAINSCFDGKFGEAGKMVIIEDFLPGTEASVFAICDGENYALLPTAQDYKRLLDGNKGPNTGGMGARSPNPLIDWETLKKIEKTIIQPTLLGMKEEGRPYKGFLYVGVMLDQNKEPFVVEFNSRLGDPETQVVLPLLECDLFEVIWQASEGNLGFFKGILPSAETSGNGAAVCVVMASQGYPDKVAAGMPIRFKVGFSLGSQSQLLDQTKEVDPNRAKILLFHAGTKLDNQRNLITSGGRVLGVTALAQNPEDAKEFAYKAVNKIDFAGKQNRLDIAAD